MWPGPDLQYTTQMRRKQFRAVSGELNQIFFDFPFQVGGVSVPCFGGVCGCADGCAVAVPWW